MGQRGNALLETAIALPLCLLLMGMLLELGSAYNASLVGRYLAFMGTRMSSVGASSAEVRRELLFWGGNSLEMNSSLPLMTCSVKKGSKDTKVTFESVRFPRFPALNELFPLLKAKTVFQLPVEDSGVYSR